MLKRLSTVAAIAFCLALSLTVANAQVLVTFDGATDLTDNFVSLYNLFADGGTSGLGNTAGVQNSFVGYDYSNVDLWTLQYGIPAGVTRTVSAFFYNGSSDGGYGGLGFSTSASNSWSGCGEAQTGLGMITHAGGGFFVNEGVETTVDYGGDQLAADQWYKITFSVTLTGANTYDLDYQIYNADAGGTVGSLVTEQVQHGVVNASFGAATTYYAYFTACASRFPVIDNFDAPEAALPIQLASLNATASSGSSVTLSWKTVSETNNYGFYVERSAQKSAGFATVSDLIPGHGTTTVAFSYQYTDRTAPAGASYYRLRQVDLDNAAHYSDAVLVSTTDAAAQSAPVVFALSQNYPNPFNPSTEFRFTVAKAGMTTLAVYNALGQEVERIFNGQTEPGKFYTARLDGSGLASGIYFARLQSGVETQMRKIVLMK